MPKYIAIGPDGRKYSFNIAGAMPTEDELRRIDARLFGSSIEATPQESTPLNDLYQSAKAGVGDLARAGGWLAGSEGVEQWGKDIADQAALDTSAGGQQAIAQGVFGGGGFEAALHGVLRSAPQMVAGLAATFAAGPAGGASAGAAILARAPMLARMAAPMAARLGISVEQFVGQAAMGSLAGSAVEGTIGGGLSGSQAADEVIRFAKSNPDEFRNSEIGSKYLAQYGGDLELAAQAAAREIANSTALKTGLTTGALALPGGLIESSLLQGALGSGFRGAARGALQSAAQEAPEEFGQSFLEQVYANQAMQGAGSSVGALDNALRAGVEGAAVGALAGGLFGGASGAFGSSLDPLSDRRRDLQDFITSNSIPRADAGGVPGGPPVYEGFGTLDGNRDPIRATYNQGAINGELGAVGEPPPYNPEYTVNTDAEYTGVKFNAPQYDLGRSGLDGLPLGRAYQEPGVLAGRDGSASYTVSPNFTQQATALAGTAPGSQGTGVEGPGFLSTGYSGKLAGQEGVPVYPGSARVSGLSRPPGQPVPGGLPPTINYRNYQQLDNRSVGTGQLPWQTQYVDKLPDDVLADTFTTYEGAGPGPLSVAPQPIPYGRPGVVPRQGAVKGLLNTSTGTLDLSKPPPSSFGDSSATYALASDGSTKTTGDQEPLRTIYVDRADAGSLGSAPLISDNLNGTITPVDDKGGALAQTGPIGYSKSPAVGKIPVRIKPVSDVNGYQIFSPQVGSEIKWVGPKAVQEAYDPQPDSAKAESQSVAPPQKDRGALGAELRKVLKKIGLNNVQVQIVDKIEGGALGAYLNAGDTRIIQLSMSPVMGKSDTEIMKHLASVMNHELMHDLFAGGVFSKQEIKRLYQYVRTQRYQDKDGKKRKFTWHEWAQATYGDRGLNEDAIYEEAIAEAFKVWAENNSGQPGLPSSLFNRIVQFLKGLGKVLAGAPNDAVFKNIQSGEIGQREMVFKGRTLKYSLSPHGQNPNPIFYSALQRAVEQSKQVKAAPRQWLNMLKQTPGVKPEEIEWTALEKNVELAEESNVKSWTKEDLLVLLRENDIEVNDVVLADYEPAPINWETDFPNQFDAEINGDKWTIFASQGSSANNQYKWYVSKNGDDVSVLNSFGEARRYVKKTAGIPDGTAKYDRSDLRLPGGSNYKELLLRIPPKNLQYPGGHYGEYPNTIVHVRFDERLVDGERAIYIDEIQSDWHHEGRTRGYTNGPQVYDPNNLTIDDLRPKQTLDGWAIVDGRGDPASRILFSSEEEAIATLNATYHNNFVKNNYKPPNAPFKNTWHELALKRMVRWAADNGIKRIALSTGDIQNKRYNLANWVDTITWGETGAPGTGDLKRVTIYMPDPEDFWVNQDGIVQSASLDGFNNQPLSEIIGKDLADTILERANSGRSGGLSKQELGDLKVGGRGKVELYDKKFVNALNKLLKKYGDFVKPGLTKNEDIKTRDAIDIVRFDITQYTRDLKYLEALHTKTRKDIKTVIADPGAGRDMLLRLKDKLFAIEQNISERTEQIAELNSKLVQLLERPAYTETPVWSASISPAMANDAIMGQPKYSLPSLYNVGQRVPPPTTTAQQRYLDVSYAAAYDELYTALSKGYRGFKTVANYVGLGQSLPAQLNGEPMHNLFRKFQSRSLPLARFIDAINQAGVQLDDAVNPYLQQQLMKARIEQDQLAGQKEVISPAEEKLKELPFTKQHFLELLEYTRLNIDPELADEIERSLVDQEPAIQNANMFGLYMNARHAAERNQYMREHWTELNEDGDYISTFNEQENGAGLTDEEAAKLIDWFESKYDVQRLHDTAQAWYDVIADTRRIAHVGKLTPDWNEHPDALAWKYYVPLVGRSDIDSSMSGTIDPSLSVKGRENRRAFGRASLANQIIPEIIRRHRVTIDRANHNALMNDLIDAIEQNPQLWEDFGQVVWQAPQVPGRKSNKKFGYVKVDPDRDPMIVTAKNLRDNPAGVQESYLRMLKLAEPWKQLADYLNGKDIKIPGDEYAIVRGGMAVNRALGGLLTRFNPEFPLSNWPRDIMGAMVNLQQYEGVKPFDVLKNAAYSLHSIYRHERDSSYTDEFTPYIDAVKNAGGLTSGYGFDNIESIRNNIIKNSQTPGKFRQTMTGVKDWMEHVNSAFENSVRVSTYKAMLDAGYSPTAAAYAAKTVTVNFDEGGTLRNWMNAAYLFFNASFQGTFGISTAAARSAKVRKALAGIAGAAFSMDILNYAMSPEDDEGRNLYDSIPEYVKSRNIILMIPGSKTYLKLPMPYGYMFFANVGRSVAGVARHGTGYGKGQTVGEATGSIMQSLVDNFNPLGGSQSFLNFVAPTVLDPLVDLARNQNFANANIYPEERGYGPGTPMSQLYWNNTSSLYTVASEILRVPGTGTDRLEGAGWEVSPNQIQYLVDFATGGVGQLANRFLNLGEKIATGDVGELEIGDVPAFRKWIGFTGGRATKQTFYDIRDKYLRYEQEIKDARADGEVDRIRAIRDKEPAIWANMGRFKALNSRRSKILRTARKLESNERIPEAQKRDKIKRLREAADQIAEQILALEAQ